MTPGNRSSGISAPSALLSSVFVLGRWLARHKSQQQLNSGIDKESGEATTATDSVDAGDKWGQTDRR